MAQRQDKKIEPLYHFLAKTPLFEHFKREEITALLRIMEVWKYDAHEPVFKENDSGDSCYIITSGAIGVQKKIFEEGNEIKLSKLKPGTIFGQVSLIDRGPRSATCIALEPSVLLKLRRNAFDALFHTGHVTAYKFQDIIARIMIQQLRLADQAYARIIQQLTGDQAEQISEAGESAASGVSATLEWHENTETETTTPTHTEEYLERDFTFED